MNLVHRRKILLHRDSNAEVGWLHYVQSVEHNRLVNSEIYFLEIRCDGIPKGIDTGSRARSKRVVYSFSNQEDGLLRLVQSNEYLLQARFRKNS